MYSNRYFSNSALQWFFVFLSLPVAVMAQVTVAVRTNNVSVLYADQSTSRQGSINIQNQGSTWSGASSMRWTVNVATAGDYKFYILNTVGAGAEGLAMKVTSQSGASLNFPLHRTTGLPQGYERDTITGTLALQTGSQWIELGTAATPTGTVMGFRGLELYPAAAEAAITADAARAKASRPSTDFMLRAKYGTMFHWTTNSINQQGQKVPWQQMVSQFDMQKFANMVVEMGVGYVLFTPAHAVRTFPAPLKMWEKYHPGMTTTRDLIMEMADSLKARGIPLMLYFPPQFAWNSPVTADFNTANREILTEIGERYGKKVVGYWFDGLYQGAEKYPDFSFESLNQYCKAGNPDRVYCLNSWIYPSVTNWQDYWAGEVAGLVTMPTTRYFTNGPAVGLQSQLLVILEPQWWMDQLGRTPSYSAQQMSNYAVSAIRNGVALTVNTMIYADGTILPASLNVFRAMKAAVVNAQPIVNVAPSISFGKNLTITSGYRELVIHGTGNYGEAVIYSMTGGKVKAFPLHHGENVIPFGILPLAPGSHVIKVDKTLHKFLIPQ